MLVLGHSRCKQPEAEGAVLVGAATTHGWVRVCITLSLRPRMNVHQSSRLQPHLGCFFSTAVSSLEMRQASLGSGHATGSPWP